jgi:hypothetical protein
MSELNHAPAQNALLPQEPAETWLSPANLSTNCLKPRNTYPGLLVTSRKQTSDILALHSKNGALPNLKQLTNCPGREPKPLGLWASAPAPNPLPAVGGKGFQVSRRAVETRRCYLSTLSGHPPNTLASTRCAWLSLGLLFSGLVRAF